MNFKKLQAMQAKLDAAILAKKATMTTEERFNKWYERTFENE